MEDEKLQKGIEDIKKIRMTADEKKRMVESVTSTPVPSYKGIRSFWVVRSFMSVIPRNRLTYYGALSCRIIFLGGREIILLPRRVSRAIVSMLSR
jgi:hypothetical protein